MAEESRPRLGRGLAALIGDSAPEPSVRAPATGQKRIPIEFIRPSPRNPRRSFDDENLAELADSIREKGVIQPLVVRPNPRGSLLRLTHTPRFRNSLVITTLPWHLRRTSSRRT